MNLLTIICETMTSVKDGIIIGSAGGAIAGIAVWSIQAIKECCLKCIHKQRVYNWLEKNITDKDGEKFRTTRTIASYCNLTEDRVRYICSFHKKIHLSTGEKEDRWTLNNKK